MAAPSGRYQSKLFNLFSKSVQQLTKLQPHLRRIQSGAVWGAQVLFYLAQRLIQSLTSWRLSAPKLAAGTNITDAALPAVSAPEPGDSHQVTVSAQPIQQLLLTAERLVSISRLSSSSLDKLPIQGIATQLATRTLVLVTTSNELLDLTPQQQKLLRQRIIWAVVSYGFHTRLARASRLLGWPQVSQELPSSAPGKHLIGFSLPTLGYLGQRFPKLPSLRTAIPFRRRLATTTVPTAVGMDELAIRALIRNAIAYFFGRRSWKLPFQASISPVSNPAAIEGEPTTEPWLSWSDLFGSTGPTQIGTGVASPTVQAPGGVADEDWLDIETEAILMGYVKHPLEQVLEWLDRVMVWLEGIVTVVWTHLRPHAQSVRHWIQGR